MSPVLNDSPVPLRVPLSPLVRQARLRDWLQRKELELAERSGTPAGEEKGGPLWQRQHASGFLVCSIVEIEAAIGNGFVE